MFLGTVWSESGFTWLDLSEAFGVLGLRYDGFLTS